MPNASPDDLSAPPPREHHDESNDLRQRAENIVRLHRVTFGTFKGKRVLYVDEPLPRKDYETLANAMRQRLI